MYIHVIDTLFYKITRFIYHIIKIINKACAETVSFVKGCPTLTTFFFHIFFQLMLGERIQILLGHHRPTSETHFDGILLAGGRPMMAQY